MQTWRAIRVRGAVDRRLCPQDRAGGVPRGANAPHDAAVTDETVVHLRDLRAQGMSYAEAHRSVAGLDRMAPAAYADTSGRNPEAVYRLRIAAALQRIDGVAASHVSAAALLALPLRTMDFRQVQLSPLAGRRAKPKGSPFHHIHDWRVPDADLSLVDGLRCTAALRTVIDCARSITGDWGVVIADAALHRGLIDADELRIRARRIRRLHGAGRARALPDLCSPRSESPGESLLRLRLRGMGLIPQEQVAMPWVEGNPRVDFLIDGWLVVEFDGQGKYLLGEDPAAAHWAEKLRDGRLSDDGKVVVHVTWPELWSEPALRQRILSIHARGGRNRPAAGRDRA